MSQYPVSEKALRDFLRTCPTVLSRLSNDTRLIDIEQRNKTSKNYVIVYRSGGSPDKYLNSDSPVFEIHCFGSTRNNSLSLAQAVMEDLAAAHNEIIGTAFIPDFDPSSVFWSPDQEAARYIVQASCRIYRVATGGTGGTGA